MSNSGNSILCECLPIMDILCITNGEVVPVTKTYHEVMLWKFAQGRTLEHQEKDLKLSKLYWLLDRQ